MECFICGAPGEFDAVSHQEIVRVCKPCSEKVGVLVIKKPTPGQIQTMEKSYTVHERLARMSGVKPKVLPLKQAQDSVKIAFPARAKPEEMRKLNLIDNFNWHLTRARRARGMSLRQFALSIQETESLLLHLEQGALPLGALHAIEKIETFLKIPLRKKELPQKSIKILGDKGNLLGKEIEIVEEIEDEK